MSLKCQCLRKCSRGQNFWSTDLADTWHRSWVWWDIPKATLAHFSDFWFWSFQGDLISCPLSTKNPAFQGTFLKCNKTRLVNCAAKWIWPWTLIIELSVYACNFVLKVFHIEEPWARVWPKLMSKLQLQIAIFQKFSVFTCLLAELLYLYHYLL